MFCFYHWLIGCLNNYGYKHDVLIGVVHPRIFALCRVNNNPNYYLHSCFVIEINFFVQLVLLLYKVVDTEIYSVTYRFKE